MQLSRRTFLSGVSTAVAAGAVGAPSVGRAAQAEFVYNTGIISRTCAIARVEPHEGMKPIWGYMLALLIGTAVVAAVPWFSSGFLK
jgi:hypothetical protein